jgi:hypothetical protein
MTLSRLNAAGFSDIASRRAAAASPKINWRRVTKNQLVAASSKINW